MIKCLIMTVIELNKLVNKLQKRIQPPKVPRPLKEKKEPSILEAPVNAPEWAVLPVDANIQSK